MERRLQLLLDQHRYDLVAAQAEKTGQSVAAVIRDAIDARFDRTAADLQRQEAVKHMLEASRRDPGPAEEWEDIKASIEASYDRAGDL